MKENSTHAFIECNKPRPRPFLTSESSCRQSKADKRLIGGDVGQWNSLARTLFHISSNLFDGSLNIYKHEKQKKSFKNVFPSLDSKWWIFVHSYCVCKTLSAAFSDWWHVLISQMYLSLSFLLKSISCLLFLSSLSSAYTRTSARRDLSRKRTWMRGQGHVVTHLYAFIFWMAPSAASEPAGKRGV